MKILILNDVASAVGGAEVLTHDLCAEFRRRGHDARVFASNAERNGGPRASEYECHGSTGPLRTLNRTVNPLAWLALRAALAAFQPDVVHVRMFMSQLSPLILPLLRETPSLYHAAWYETICPKGTRLLPDATICEETPGRACHRTGCLSKRAWVALMAQRALWQRWRDVFVLVVANSAATERRLVQFDIGPTEVIWNGVRQRPARPPLSGPPTVAYAGRLSREKGVDVLLRAYGRILQRLPEARLLVVGDGPDRAALEALARDVAAHGAVEWTGHLPRDEMERVLEAAWVHVVPSILEEPFGLTAAEAMMRGTAVVVSAHGGLAEIVRFGETGVHVRPGDDDALADTLADLLSDRDRCEALGRAGRDWAWDRLSVERCADAFLDVYDRVVAARAA